MMKRLLQIFFSLCLPLVFLSLNCAEKKKIQSRYSFVKTVVAEALSEPIQMGQLPNGKIMFIERYGAVKLYDPTTRTLTTAHELAVAHPPEEGLLGMAIDPKWSENHWVYFYYSPQGEEVVNQLSRFVFDENGRLDPASEKVLIKVPVQRQECCHSGGGICFDDEGNLYLGIGDNTNATDDYAGIDERPGRSPFDSQKSASNSMDLRGKILRIKPLPDGSYICPAGNLFAKEEVHVTNNPQSAINNPQSVGRAEIYAMGCRNPFRLTFDNRRKILYWADVGPDASNPDTLRGPEGFDEINRTAEAGNYGWPYCIADNKPYRDYDFATQKAGAWFDPQKPFNDSPNNTGLRDLPPAQPAMIWYSYNPSDEFPILNSDEGRSAMVGQVYYADKYPEETRLPDFYDGKLFIYDWMRNWIVAVELDTAGYYVGMEKFAPDLEFVCPVDMLIDKNGAMWVLDYGTQKYAANPDARLSRIDLVRENRAPNPVLEADKSAGAAPLEVVFSVEKTRDPEGDALTYEIDFGDDTERYTADGTRFTGSDAQLANSDSKISSASEPSTVNRQPSTVTHIFEKTGTYEVTLKVTDAQGKWDTTTLLINVGNAPPLVEWDLGGKNRSFYQPGDVLNYKIAVDDPEEGTLANGGIAPNFVATTADYMETGFDFSLLNQKKSAADGTVELAKGKILIDRSDCKSCHATDRLVNGPAFLSIAERYRNDPAAVRKLAERIIKGGGGNWGAPVMVPHPHLSEADASEMVRWMLTLGAAPKPKQSLPVEGNFSLVPKSKTPGTFILKAAYRDKGAKGQAPLETTALLALRPALQQTEQADSISKGATVFRPFGDEVAVLNNLTNNQFFCFKYVDLTGLASISVNFGMADHAGGRVELRLDSPDGTLAGMVEIQAENSAGAMAFLEKTLTLNAPSDGRFHDLYFVFKNENEPQRAVAAVDWVRFNLQQKSAVK
jgi:cytochrome c